MVDENRDAKAARLGEKQEVSIVAADGRTYISLGYPTTILLQLETVRLVHDIRPFSVEDGNRKSATTYRKLTGTAATHVALGVAGIPQSGTQGVLVIIYGYPDDASDGDVRSVWRQFAAQGWPGKISTFCDEYGDGEYHWHAEVFVGEVQFEELLQIYRSEKLGKVNCSLTLDNLLIDEEDQWAPDGHDHFFIACAKGKEKHPDSVMGLVSSITFSEGTPIKPELPDTIKELTRKLGELEFEVNDLRQRWSK